MGIEITDWIAGEGLIKRRISIERVTLTTPTGETNGESVESITTITLKSLNIK